MKKLSGLIAGMFMMLTLVTGGIAQERQAQEPGAKARPARPDQKPTGEPAESADPQRETETQEEALRRALAELSQQMGLLASEMRKLRQESERTSMTLELLLYEERLARVEEKIDDALQEKLQLDAREQEVQYRLRNIQQEVMRSGALRREEAEAAIRAQLQNTLEDIRNQQTAYQQRIAGLQAQAERLRQRVETLRKRLEPPEEKEQQEK